MYLEKRDLAFELMPRADKCKTECNQNGGSETAFNTAHGQTEADQRKAKNQPSSPC